MVLRGPIGVLAECRMEDQWKMSNVMLRSFDIFLFVLSFVSGSKFIVIDNNR